MTRHFTTMSILALLTAIFFCACPGKSTTETPPVPEPSTTQSIWSADEIEARGYLSDFVPQGYDLTSYSFTKGDSGGWTVYFSEKSTAGDDKSIGGALSFVPSSADSLYKKQREVVGAFTAGGRSFTEYGPISYSATSKYNKNVMAPPTSVCESVSSRNGVDYALVWIPYGSNCRTYITQVLGDNYSYKLSDESMLGGWKDAIFSSVLKGCQFEVKSHIFSNLNTKSEVITWALSGCAAAGGSLSLDYYTGEVSPLYCCDTSDCGNVTSGDVSTVAGLILCHYVSSHSGVDTYLKRARIQSASLTVTAEKLSQDEFVAVMKALGLDNSVDIITDDTSCSCPMD